MTVPSTASPSSEPRAAALDALRGLAILAMLLSGLLPFGANSLPSWMYHAQVPPPHHIFIPIPGITWVDLVFPFFLFSMGAAFPLAMSKRLRSGTSEWALVGAIFKRGFLLGFFAFFVVAIRPYILSDNPGRGAQLLALLGYAILFPVLCRLPQQWSPALRWTIRVAGWGAAILFLALPRYADGSGFSLRRSDIIIVVLTNMAVFGALIWLVTRDHLLPRLGVIGVVLAIRLSNMPHPLGGWVSDWWAFSPVPWIYQLYYLQYLCIVIPGTVAGDLLVQWARSRPVEEAPGWSNARMAALAALLFALPVIALVGLKSRWLVATPMTIFVLCFAGWALVKPAATPTEQLYQRLFLWAAYWLVLGFILESYEGGIRKDKATISYYFVTSGLANCLLILLSMIYDVWKRGRWLRLLAETGQNPMIAYAGVNSLITPLLVLTGLQGLLDNWAQTPWRGFWEGVLITLLMALVTSYLTRRKIFWRT